MNFGALRVLNDSIVAARMRFEKQKAFHLQ